MSRGFEQAPSIANPFASVPNPFRHDEPAPAADPYPGWKPTSRGDSNALLPYVDDDVRDEPITPVNRPLLAGDVGHVIADGAIDGGVEAENLSQLASKMGHHANKGFAGEGTVAQTRLMEANGVLAPLAI